MATTLQAPARERVTQWWQLRSAGERRSLAFAAVAAIAALAWLALWQPLVADVEHTTRQLASQRATLAEARRQADDIASLERSTTAPPPRDARADLGALLTRRGLKPTAIDRLDNDRVRLTFDAIGFDALAAFIDSVQREAGLRAVDLTSTARVESGQVRAELTLAP